MEDQLSDIFEAYCDVLIKNLTVDEVSVEWAKEARELLKAMKYDAAPVSGSKVEKVSGALSGVPTF